MSRGDRVATSGNLKLSMRDNYAAHGVEEYYKKVSASYRNPHYPGVRKCLFSWYASWWKEEYANASSPIIFDMACGTGEAIIALKEWWHRGLLHHKESLTQSSDATQTIQPVPRRRTELEFLPNPPLSSETPLPRVMAADPYTAKAFTDRVALPCASLSFTDIAQGSLPNEIYTLPLPSLGGPGGSEPMVPATISEGDSRPDDLIEMVICSFALHLIESPSELFSLLWELSTKCRWLVVLAPHKKPEIKDGWGWVKWNVTTWSSCSISSSQGELLYDKVHCRVYRSLSTM
ncbi:uncharacterized protein STEHIDRAFT_58524 [Stereum hirsutum FP-91666 SS1]|uniref:uncharacterized protein n=1 Tax=Stereum hirsutum (strain FP-91666) TaxID=721885 RepID=UPI00044491E5|nr:uncharacterized protein STEHIDRAFT_58524 [Stereum hirsutum FP-91666 SS1]EIM85878.1 hypothetical protein STEHIDRAFT_58524 [Stereum hirsutum FP-91666 SS1]